MEPIFIVFACMKKMLSISCIAVGLLFAGCGNGEPVEELSPVTGSGTSTSTGENMQAHNMSGSGQTEQENILLSEDMIRVASPLPNATVERQMQISGQARTWYFEGSFPISIIDNNQVLLYEGSIKADGDWMTTDFVPFDETIMLSVEPTAAAGKIIFTKANPSDLPEHDAHFELPVIFKNR